MLLLLLGAAIAVRRRRFDDGMEVLRALVMKSENGSVSIASRLMFNLVPEFPTALPSMSL